MLTTLLLLAAQDLSTEWMDRVSHDTIYSKGPLSTKPVHHTLNMGLLSYYESNVNLEESGTEAESVLVPFLRLRLEYSERQVDAAADILASYKYYIPDHKYSDDEERVYGRARFISPKLELEIAEIFQHVSDPVGVVFANRVDRFVNETYGRARLETIGGVWLEGDLLFGAVRYQEKTFDENDNMSLRAGAGLAVTMSQVMDAVVQGGAMMVDYRYETGAPPDVEGLYLRGGVRGDLLPTLSLTALLGVAQMESDDFESGAAGSDDEDVEAELHLRWQASPKLTVYGDYSRMFTFSAAPEPYQLVNRLTGLAELEAAEGVRLRFRLQWDHADGSEGIEREWISAGTGVQWQTHAQVAFDAGMTLRWGGTEGAPADYDYEDIIVHFGMIISN